MRKPTRAELALIEAAEKGDLATLKRLVAKLAPLKRLVRAGVNVNAANCYGLTALMAAAWYGKLDCLDHVIAKGANLEATDDDSQTALMWAAGYGMLDCLDHLIAKGANVHHQSRGKYTALHYAADEGHAPCVESLLKAGADASLEDENGTTALDDAKEKKHTDVIKLLEKSQPGVIRWNELTIGRQLGSGGFGVVYAALWKLGDVAVKQIKPELIAGKPESQKDFQAELELLLSLRYRHIVQCYGGSCEHEFVIVTELMERGSLHDCLRKHREEFAWLGLGKKVLLDAAKGLLYLHALSPPLVHFDIKPLNVLVSEDNVGKLADVGLTRRMEHSVTRPQGWTPMYAAPEILMRQGANEKSDIYSFGLIVWEVYTGRQPSQFDRCEVDANWSVAPLLQGGGATGHGGALAPEMERRPSAQHLKDALSKLQSKAHWALAANVARYAI